jgi:hypothetical protein
LRADVLRVDSFRFKSEKEDEDEDEEGLGKEGKKLSLYRTSQQRKKEAEI